MFLMAVRYPMKRFWDEKKTGAAPWELGQLGALCLATQDQFGMVIASEHHVGPTGVLPRHFEWNVVEVAGL